MIFLFKFQSILRSRIQKIQRRAFTKFPVIARKMSLVLPTPILTMSNIERKGLEFCSFLKRYYAGSYPTLYWKNSKLSHKLNSPSTVESLLSRTSESTCAVTQHQQWRVYSHELASPRVKCVLIKN